MNVCLMNSTEWSHEKTKFWAAFIYFQDYQPDFFNHTAVTYEPLLHYMVFIMLLYDLTMIYSSV